MTKNGVPTNNFDTVLGSVNLVDRAAERRTQPLKNKWMATTAMTVSDLSVLEEETMTQPLKKNGWQGVEEEWQKKPPFSEGFLIKQRVLSRIR
jgi:hypothetical protein